MINVEIDISAIKNEVTQIYNELHSTYNMGDSQRRDTVNMLVERARSLRDKLEKTEVVTTLK